MRQPLTGLFHVISAMLTKATLFLILIFQAGNLFAYHTRDSMVKDCVDYANFAEQVALARDEGFLQQPTVNFIIDQSKTSERAITDSITIIWIYSRHDMTPDMIMKHAMEMCMRTY